MHISHGEAKAYLKSHGWLAGLAPDMRDDLLAITTCVTLSGGQTLYPIEGAAGGMFGLASGCIAFEAAQSGNFIQKGLLAHPSAWFGTALLAGAKGRMVGAHATRPSTLLSVGGTEFKSFATRHPDIWRQLLLLEIGITANVIGLAQDLMRRDSRDRLMAILARLASLRDAHPPNPAVIDATQSEIAAIANLSRSSTSALLLDMEGQGLLRLGRASVEVLDPAKLLSQIDD